MLRSGFLRTNIFPNFILQNYAYSHYFDNLHPNQDRNIPFQQIRENLNFSNPVQCQLSHV